ncbi:MAG: hypothetical protein LBU65_16610 [Planctomycetaceae bacterium]|nr:hypothetical protein [Planctomycetaceae bacterium]
MAKKLLPIISEEQKNIVLGLIKKLKNGLIESFRTVVYLQKIETVHTISVLGDPSFSDSDKIKIYNESISYFKILSNYLVDGKNFMVMVDIEPNWEKEYAKLHSEFLSIIMSSREDDTLYSAEYSDMVLKLQRYGCFKVIRDIDLLLSGH